MDECRNEATERENRPRRVTHTRSLSFRASYQRNAVISRRCLCVPGNTLCIRERERERSLTCRTIVDLASPPSSGCSGKLAGTIFRKTHRAPRLLLLYRGGGFSASLALKPLIIGRSEALLYTRAHTTSRFLPSSSLSLAVELQWTRKIQDAEPSLSRAQVRYAAGGARLARGRALVRHWLAASLSTGRTKGRRSEREKRNLSARRKGAIKILKRIAANMSRRGSVSFFSPTLV